MKKVLLLLAEGFEIYEASAFIDVMGWNLIEGDGSTKLFSVASKKEIRSTFHQCFKVDFDIDEIDVNNFDALAIPGGFEEYGFYRDAYSEKFINLIQDFKSKNKPIASICVGSLPIAKCGILTNKKGTTYSFNPERIKELESFGVNYIGEPIVVDDNIITSWNPSTAISVALLLLEILTTKKNAEHIRKIMGFKID